MKSIYLRETEKTYDIIKRMSMFIKKILNIVTIEETNNYRIYYLPIFENEKISKHKMKKLVNKIILLMEIKGTTRVVLSKYLDNNQLFKNYLYSKNINVLNGRFLFKCLIYETIEYVFKTRNENIKFRRSFNFS